MIDWTTGAIAHPQATDIPASGARWTLVSAGDWAAVHGFGERMVADPLGPYGDLLPVIQGADLAMVNLETVLSERGTPIVKDGPNLRGPSEAIDSLVGAGFRVASLANNHARDYGWEALEDTLALCDDRGVRTVGVGRTEAEAWAPVYVDVAGLVVAVLALAEHEEAALRDEAGGVAAWDIARAEEAVRRARREADLVVYQCHAGTEYNPLPAPRISDAYHRLIDAGAALVIGHHPHVPMGVEEYGGGLIAYSLGNLLFDFRHHDTPARVHEGYMLEVEFAGSAIAGGRIIPHRAVDGHHLEWLRGEDAIDLLGHLERISRPLGDAALLAEYWGAFCDTLYPVRWGRGLVERLAALASEDEGERRRGAAKLRNALRCEAHWDTLTTALDRIAEGTVGTSRQEVLKEALALNPWLKREVTPFREWMRKHVLGADNRGI